MENLHNKKELQKPVTLGVLLEFTDEILMPRMSDLMDEKLTHGLGELKHEIKEHIDKKLDDYTTDIFKRLDKKYQKDKQFKEKIVDLFKRHKIGTAEELAFLDGLVSGG